jgi:glucuronate isomerase
MGPPPGAFIREDFLLTTPPACRLYHQFAEAEPFSTTGHPSPQNVAVNRQFQKLDWKSGWLPPQTRTSTI